MVAISFLFHFSPGSTVKSYWDHKGRHKEVMEFSGGGGKLRHVSQSM